MASGDFIDFITPQRNEKPPSAGAEVARRNGHPVIEFPDDSSLSAVFTSYLPAYYDTGGLTVVVACMADTATSSTYRLDLGFESHTPGTDDLDSDSFATLNANNSETTTTNGTAGVLTLTTFTLTESTDTDGWAVNESARLRLTRDHDHAGDLMSGKLQFRWMRISET